MELSYNKYNLYCRCPLLYKKKYDPNEPKVEMDKIKAFAGTVCHAIYEKWYLDKKYDYPSLFSNIDFFMQKDIEENKFEMDLKKYTEYRNDIIKYLHNFLGLVKEHRLIGKDVYVEIPYKQEITENLILNGRVDLALETVDKKFVVVDYKLSKDRTYIHKHQILNYVLALEKVFNRPIDSAAFMMVRMNCMDWIDIGEASKEEAKTAFSITVKSILNEEFNPTPHRHTCAYCDYRVTCTSSRFYKGPLGGGITGF